MKIFLVLVTFIASFSLSSESISVTPLVVDFTQQDSGLQNLTVVNTGEVRAYVQVTVSLLENPGTEQETEMTIKDPEAMGLLVSPLKLAIPVGESRLVRVLLTQPITDKERIYIVKVEPVVGEVTAITSGVKVLVGYGVRVIVRPEEILPKLSISRDQRQVTVRNTGNSNVVLFDGQQCETPEKCEELPARRMYAGNIWQFEAPFDAPVKFSQSLMGDVTDKLVSN